MKIPRYIVIKLEMIGKDTVKATEITDRCEVYEYEADEGEQITSKFTDVGNSMVSAVESTMSQLKGKLKTEPQTGVTTDCRQTRAKMFGEMDDEVFKEHCMNCQRDTADIKCLDCDGNKYFLSYEPQTERHLPDYSYEADLGRRIMEQTERSNE